MKKAVLFDMDGVVIDSEQCWTRADNAMVRRLAPGFTYENVKSAVLGKRMAESAAIFKVMYNITASAEEINAVRMEELIRQYDKELRPEEGFIVFAERLKSLSVKTALASGSPHALMDYVVKRFGFEKYFDVRVSCDDVLKGKPEPDVFLESSLKLEVQPRECLVIEDAESGIEAAKRAGMTAVAYVRPYTNGGKADYRIRSFNDFDMRWLDNGKV